MKYLAIVMALFLGLNGIAIKETEKTTEIKEKIEIGNCASLLVENKPIVPVYIKTYILPAGSKFSIYAEPSIIKNLGKMDLPASYIPAPPGGKIRKGRYDPNIIYPEKWYSYKAFGGIKNDEHVVILNLYLYPIRYIKGNVFYADEFNVQLRYNFHKPLFKDEYDLLIICPSQWKDDLIKLKQHKESYGIRTLIATLDEIKNKGRDEAEKIKYFIKDCIEKYGIKYVLLVGGRKPGLKERWIMPVRYVNVFWASESRYISDLYFADIYDENYSFSSWDSDGNGIYSEWKSFGHLKDKVDLYPDVYVGRLPCRNKIELRIMINKIIEYEKKEAKKKVVLVGGDNFENEGYEGEIVCNKTLEYLPDFEAKKVYASKMDVSAKNIKNALGNGAIFIHFHGHGSPIYWSTHKPNKFDKWEKGIGIWDLPTFFNKEYPIAIFGGCHTAMFNVSLTIHPWTGKIPAPECISWWFARKYKGGGIASLGYTCFPVATPGNEGDLDGNGIDEPDCVESGYGYMQLGLFDAYSNGKKYLGECWGNAVARYVEHFMYPYQRWHFHTIQGFVLLGDPALRIK